MSKRPWAQSSEIFLVDVVKSTVKTFATRLASSLKTSRLTVHGKSWFLEKYSATTAKEKVPPGMAKRPVGSAKGAARQQALGSFEAIAITATAVGSSSKRHVQRGGEGRVHRRDTIRVKVPAGVATGQKLKLTGKGNAPYGKGRYGDLFVIVNVSAHALFRRRGDDLIADLPLRYNQLVLGDEALVPTLEGSTYPH